MTQYGGGTGTPITGGGAGVGGAGYGGAVSLAQYALRIGYCECSFFGVNDPDCQQFECRNIWTGSQRSMIAQALLDAQGMIEEELGFFLAPTWTTGERHVYRSPILARWGHVIAGGIMSDTIIQAGVAVNHATDPATVIMGGVTCPANSIHVYHAGTDIEITPTDVSIVAGVLTVTIPWCRLVAPAYANNGEDGLQYSDHATWIAATVDVHCITNDPSVQGVLIASPGCSCTTAPCADTEYAACIHVRQPEIGSLDLTRADYSDGSWVRKSMCVNISWAELNYLSGLEDLPRGAEDAIIRLAHSLMPEEPCGCDVTQRLWKRDRNTPQVLTRERINCPWGLSDGAWYAWQWTQTRRLRRGAVL